MIIYVCWPFHMVHVSEFCVVRLFFEPAEREKAFRDDSYHLFVVILGTVYWVWKYCIYIYTTYIHECIYCNTTGCLTRHVTISLAFSASQLFILRKDKGLKNGREGHESKFLQFMVTSGFPLRRISLDPMISESSGFEGGSIILVLPGFMWAPGQTVSLDSRHLKFYLDDSFYPWGAGAWSHESRQNLGVRFPFFQDGHGKKQPSQRIFQGKSIEICEHLQFYLRFKPSKSRWKTIAFTIWQFMGKAMVSRWFPFFPFKKPGRAGQRCLGDGDDFRALYDVVWNVSI